MTRYVLIEQSKGLDLVAESIDEDVIGALLLSTACRWYVLIR